MLKSWPHPASLHGAEMRFLAANEPLCRMMGAEAAALLGKSLLELSGPCCQRDAQSGAVDHAEGEREVLLEGRLEAGSGRHLRWQALPAPGRRGLWVAGWEVLEPEASPSSPASRWLIEAALQAADEIVGIVAAQVWPVFVNRALERLLGAALGTLREAGSAAGFYADLAQRKAILEAVWSQGRWDGEVAARTTSGEIIPFQCTYSRVENPDGRPAGIICIGWDLRPWKQREQELKRILGELQTVLEVVPAGVVTLDLAGHVIGWNRRAEEIFGWQAAEVLGQPAPFWTERERQEAHRQMEEALRHGRSMAREYRAERKDGSAL